MSAIKPGDVFKLTWSVLGITDMVVRVLSVKYGTLQKGQIELSCMEDVFHTETATYSDPPSTGWTSPKNDPADVTNYMLQEAPYWDIVEQIGVTGAAALGTTIGFLMTAAGKPSDDSLDYELLIRDGIAEDFRSDGRGNFTPTATLDAALPLNAVDITTAALSSAEGLLNVVVGTYAVVENEILKVLAISTTNETVNLARGCLDTVPAVHAEDSRIWFIGSINYPVGATYVDDDVPGVKFLPTTPKGQLEEGDATAHNSAAMNSRFIKPYPPGDFKVDGASYPATFTGEPTLTWKHRNRTTQVDTIIEHDNTTIAAEVGTTYEIDIYKQDLVTLARAVTGLTGETYTYAEADENSDCGGQQTQLRFVLRSVRGGFSSHQSYDITVVRAV